MFDNDFIDENYDRCYECQGYGDDYYIDDDGDLVCSCFDCPFSDYYWVMNGEDD